MFIRAFSPELADAADDVHAAMGNPLDHAAEAAAVAGAEWIAPGSGPVVGGVLDARRAGVFNAPP
jgi:hypothetical protein